MAKPAQPSSGYLDPYREAVGVGGSTFEALLWRNREFQQTRFRALIETAAAGIASLSPAPTGTSLANRCIADMGCGRADLFAWLNEHRFPFGRYVGVEAIPEFVETSRQVAAGDQGMIIEADFASDDHLFESLVRSHGVEVFLFSGSLNTFRQEDALRVVERAFQAVQHLPAGGVVFNFLSSLSTNAGVVDTGPAHRFDTHAASAFASGLSRAFTLRHDYLQSHDATIGIFTEPSAR